MKKLVLFALLFAVATTSAHAAVGPKPGRNYQCYYWNYSGVAVNGGKSTFDVSGTTLVRGIEYFDAYLPRFGNYRENYKVTFMNPVPIRERDESGTWILVGTRWQFTFNPSGPQCTAEIYDGGDSLFFFNCSDGHSRNCGILP